MYQLYIFAYVYQLSQHHLLKRLFSPPCGVLGTLSNIKYILVIISEYILFHWSVCLFVYHYYCFSLQYLLIFVVIRKYDASCFVLLYTDCFPEGSAGKECKKCKFDSWVRNIPWKRKGQPISVFLPKSKDCFSHAGTSVFPYKSLLFFYLCEECHWNFYRDFFQVCRCVGSMGTWGILTLQSVNTECISNLYGFFNFFHQIL